MESEAALSREFEAKAQNADPHHDRHQRKLAAASGNPGPPDKIRLAGFLRGRRNELGLTQQSLSERLGVRASHIALLENGRRRPSLRLIGRLASELCVEGRGLLELAYPEIKSLLSPIPKPRARPNSSWERLFKDRSLLARYRVTRQELEVLERLSSLGGKVTAKRLLAILLLARDNP
jgi:transcriptional regulator with XRE-family HTH domain